jgi:hypothetical protein
MNYFVITDGDHQVRNNVAFDKADTPPLIEFPWKANEFPWKANTVVKC